MKVAVLYSGQIRGESYKDNIWKMKRLLPHADFFYTAWKGDGNYPWITKYFNEPKIKYNCERYIHVESLKTMRQQKDELGYVPEDSKARKVLSSEFRKIGRDRIKQHIAHALAFKKFCLDKDYDVVIRVRYDLRFENFDRKDMQYLIELCYKKKKPVSIGYMGDIPSGELSEINPPTNYMGDVLICHRADMFNPYHVFDLVENKKLKSAEGGWWQILCEYYNTNAYCANNMWAWIERDRWR